MDTENAFLCATLFAIAIGAFILWGPSSPRPRRKAGHIGGLMNLGNTCFINTLLQALASCPRILEWLSHQQRTTRSLTEALHTVLLVLNGQHPIIRDDPFVPTNVLKSLMMHGWVISPGEQDAHELFHVVMSTLKEEAQAASVKVMSLSDALAESTENEMCHSRISPKKKQADTSNTSDVPSPGPSGNLATVDCHIPSLPPFQGLLTSQLQCTACNYKSPVLYDKFESLSLSLPSLGEVFMKRPTLLRLLDNYVATEIVKDVACEGCNRHQNGAGNIKTNALKTLNFGKLPKCLCFHIQRTTWQPNGQALKRYDHVDFPEFLSMDAYTYAQVQRKKAMYQNCQNGEQGAQSIVSKRPPVNYRLKHLYRLMAIVVHTGDLENGHFVTYRRAPYREHSWYFTSDSEVRESSLHEAMQACAYMLFYSKNTRRKSAASAMNI